MKYVLLLVFICLLIPSTIQAQSKAFDLSVSPQIIQIQLTPPATAQVKKTITLENNSDTSLPLTITFKPFRPLGENGEIEYLDPEEKIGNDPAILEKISITENDKPITTFQISPKTKKQLDITTSIPKDEPPGDYYFSVLFTSSSATSSALNTYSQAIGGVALNVLVSIGPRGNTKGTIEEFSTDFFKPQGPVSFTVKIHNKSPHFIAPQAQILISNMFGQRIGKIDLLPVNILANSTRSLPSKEEFVFAANNNEKKNKQIDLIQKMLTKNHQALAVWPETFLLGPYKATLTVALSDEGPIYVKTIHFIGLPVYVIAAVGICLFLVTTIKVRLRARDNEKSTP